MCGIESDEMAGVIYFFFCVERTFKYSVSSTCVYSVNDSSRIDEVAALFCFPPGARCKCVALSPMK